MPRRTFESYALAAAERRHRERRSDCTNVQLEERRILGFDSEYVLTWDEDRQDTSEDTESIPSELDSLITHLAVQVEENNVESVEITEVGNETHIRETYSSDQVRQMLNVDERTEVLRQMPYEYEIRAPLTSGEHAIIWQAPTDNLEQTTDWARLRQQATGTATSQSSEPSEPSPEELRDRLNFTEDGIGTGRYRVESTSVGWRSNNKVRVGAIDHNQSEELETHPDLHQKLEQDDILYFENGHLKGKQQKLEK